ncbi:MAG: glycosyltransferase [Actinobacteria bacterium]|nr:glycosyltransferase [Actinomycetota bacterium]
MRVFTRGDTVVYGVLTSVTLAALAFFAWRWSSGEWSPAVVVLTLLGLAAIVLQQLRWLALPRMVRPRRIEPEQGLQVAVVTTFMPDVEPLEMLHTTLLGLVGMEYPHDTWVLDEGDDPRVRQLCAAVGAHHFSRRAVEAYNQPVGTFKSASKHGNYNAWLHAVGFGSYDVLVAFDPDHIPSPGYLVEVLGFLRDPRVGYVQAAQVYYNQRASFIARGSAEETYAYYSSICMTVAASGFPTVVGCHSTHRMQALHDVGGFAAHDADDVLISLLYRRHGWQGVYVPKPLALGLTPVDWDGYLRQQRRWARSVLDIEFRRLPALTSKLPKRTRLLSLLHGLYYLQGAAICVTVGVLALAQVRPLHLPAAAVLWLPAVLLAGTLLACRLFRQRFYLSPREEAGFLWRALVLRFAKWPALTLALVDVVRRHEPAYAVTSKTRRPGTARFVTAAQLVAVLVLLVALAAGVAMDSGTTSAHLVAAVLVAASLAVFATEFRQFPPPFDPELARRAAARLAHDASPPASPGTDSAGLPADRRRTSAVD